MNSLIVKALSALPWFKILLWLLEESRYYQKVATYLEAEDSWLLKVAAVAWAEMEPETDLSIIKDILRAWK